MWKFMTWFFVGGSKWGSGRSVGSFGKRWIGEAGVKVYVLIRIWIYNARVGDHEGLRSCIRRWRRRELGWMLWHITRSFVPLVFQRVSIFQFGCIARWKSWVVSPMLWHTIQLSSFCANMGELEKPMGCSIKCVRRIVPRMWWLINCFFGCLEKPKQIFRMFDRMINSVGLGLGRMDTYVMLMKKFGRWGFLLLRPVFIV